MVAGWCGGARQNRVMAFSYRPVVRNQVFLLPPDMAEWLPEDHLVWFVIEVVDQLDTSGFHRQRRLGGQGRQGYDPDMLLGLLLYAYAVGERSSRRIERLCGDHVAFRVLCAQDAPDHTTLARFRADHEAEFKDLFAQVLRLCADAGMVKVGVVAIDGTKIAANAARGANRSPAWVREQAAKIADEVVDEAAATDATEDAQDAAGGGDGDGDLPAKFATHRARAANIARALAELERRDAANAEADAADAARAADYVAEVAKRPKPGRPPAGVDPVAFQQARLAAIEVMLAEWEGVRGRSGSDARYYYRSKRKTVEAALAKTQEQVAAGTVDLRGPTARDRDRRADRARERGAQPDQVNLTDPDSRLMAEGSGGGSIQGYNAQLAVSDDHFIVGTHISQDANDTDCYTPTLDAASTHTDALGKTIGLVLADAGYFTEDNLTAPGPDRLIAPGKHHEVAAEARDNPTTDPPPNNANATDKMRHRLRHPDNAQRYKRRGATAEPVIGHLKDTTRLRRFARRGLQAVTAELDLAATAINLTRLHTRTNTT